MSHLTSENNFLAYIRDHENGFSDFCFDLELKKCFKKDLLFPWSVPSYIRKQLSGLHSWSRNRFLWLFVLRSVLFDRPPSFDPWTSTGRSSFDLSCSIGRRPSIRLFRSGVVSRSVLFDRVSSFDPWTSIGCFTKDGSFDQIRKLKWSWGQYWGRKRLY